MVSVLTNVCVELILRGKETHSEVNTHHGCSVLRVNTQIQLWSLKKKKNHFNLFYLLSIFKIFLRLELMAAADSVFPIIFQYLKPNEGRLGIAE